MKSIMKHNIKKSLPVKLLQSLLIATVLVPVYADDTEIFYTESKVNSNVLFVMDNSGSMSELVDGTDSIEDVIVTSTIDSSKDDVESEDLTNWHDGIYLQLPTWQERSDYSQRIKNGLINTDSSDLELTREDNIDGDIKQVVALRFEGINIEKNTVIKSAYIQFTADDDEWDTSSDAANIKIEIENRSTPQEFIRSGDYRNYYKGVWRSRNWHTPAVNWSPAAWDIPNERGEAQKTPDLTALVQKAVNRWGWNPSKPMVFRFRGTGKRSAQSFDHDEGSGAPELVITYEKITPLQSRLQVMQSALKVVLESAPSNLSVGISHYGDRTGGSKDKPNGIKFPATSLNKLARPIVEAAVTINGVPNWTHNNNPTPNDTVTVREYLSEIADSWEAKGATPIVDALYEAARYYRGDKLYWGNGRAKDGWAANATTYAKPAPDLVEAILNKDSVDVCAGTPKSQWIGRWNNGYDYIKQVRDGDQWWKCPADVANPPGASYSKANCLATENSCNTKNPEWYCLNWKGKEEIPGSCDLVGPDEDGKFKKEDCDYKKAYCKNASQSRKYTNRFTNVDDDAQIPNGYGKRVYSACNYKRCVDDKTKNPVPEYISPAIADCQSNNIILMSDGKPEYKGFGDEGINKLPRGISKVKELIEDAACESAPFGFRSGRCGKELTHYLAENDINPGLNGDQLINTFVIGFASGITADAEGYLKSLVTVEDDPDTEKKEGYFSAQNKEELAEAFTALLEEIAEEARSQASPGYSVNVKSGLEHEDDIYIPVFDKSTGSRWSGNLKKFKIVDDGTHRYIRGKVTKEGDSEDTSGYINAMTELGLFKDDAWDEWSTSEIPDGNNVEKGGTASLLVDPSVRKLYSNLSSNDLTDAGNQIKPNNPSILEDKVLFAKGDLGLNDADAEKYRKKLVRFIRGWVQGENADDDGNAYEDEDIASNARKHMGDMLHSEPVVISYKHGDDDGVGKEQYIFAATNEGYLHAFDSTTGEEVFAFMPKELLKNIHNQFTQEGDHVYGIDGQISYWHDDKNNDGQVDKDSEHVWLFFGLRRGGKSYYALDITDIDEPELKWVVEGGSAGFEQLSQSWSAPYIASIREGNDAKPVVIFTGGNDSAEMDYGSGDDYDPASVTGSNATEAANGVYIVDADDGSKLWDLSMVTNATSMPKHGIPGGARILDTNRNGYLDRLYFADTGGYVWRLDLDEELGPDSVLTEFARLGVDQARKFYNEPDVAILRGNGKTVFSVSLGSGLRPHPMNEEIVDHMFVLLDKFPYGTMATDYDDPIEMKSEDLAMVNIKGDNDSKSLSKSADFEGKKITEIDDIRGWYVKFGQPGEKVLATSITFEGSIIFTTLVPKVLSQGELISVCAAPSTQGRIYALNILTGEASMDLDDNDEVNDNDAFLTISASEIPGTPQRVFGGLSCSGGSCEHNVDVRIGKKSKEIESENVEAIESVYWSAPEANQ